MTISQNKWPCKNWEECNDYAGMVMDSTAVDCHGCPAYVPDKLSSSIPSATKKEATAT